jgi:hypothetical protein
MLRHNLAGLIEPMVDRAGAHPLGGHPKAGSNGGCSRSTELPIVALKRSWRQIFRWKPGRQVEKAKWPGFEVTTAAHDSRAVATAWHQRHRTIDPQCLKKSPPRRGGIYALTKNLASPFHAEPRHRDQSTSLFRIELSLLCSFNLGDVTQCQQSPSDTLALAKLDFLERRLVDSHDRHHPT